MEDARRGKITLTRIVMLINLRSNRKAIKRKIDIVRVTMGFNLLMESECASITNVVGLIPHIPLTSMIHVPPMCQIINPSPFLLPIYFQKQLQQQVVQFPLLTPI